MRIFRIPNARKLLTRRNTQADVRLTVYSPPWLATSLFIFLANTPLGALPAKST